MAYFSLSDDILVPSAQYPLPFLTLAVTLICFCCFRYL